MVARSKIRFLKVGVVLRMANTNSTTPSRYKKWAWLTRKELACRKTVLYLVQVGVVSHEPAGISMDSYIPADCNITDKWAYESFTFFNSSNSRKCKNYKLTYSYNYAKI